MRQNIDDVGLAKFIDKVHGTCPGPKCYDLPRVLSCTTRRCKHSWFAACLLSLATLIPYHIELCNNSNNIKSHTVVAIIKMLCVHLNTIFLSTFQLQIDKKTTVAITLRDLKIKDNRSLRM